MVCRTIIICYLKGAPELAPQIPKINNNDHGYDDEMMMMKKKKENIRSNTNFHVQNIKHNQQ